MAGLMARNIVLLVTLFCWLPDFSFSQNDCTITNICDSTQSKCRTMENVALGKSAEISSSLKSWDYGDSGPACVAVNGYRHNHYTKGVNGIANCAHTNNTDYTGWWQVYLGRNYTIQNISIYSQDTGDRLSQVRVTIDDQICYEFQDIAWFSIINVTCNTPLTGSTVRFEKRQRAAGNAYYLVLCEVEIWVCRAGLYGTSCKDRCNCKDNDICDKYYGTCPNDCVEGYYSANCSQKCGHCHDFKCHINNGQCMSGCQSGWTGQYCSEPCPDYYYGPYCTNKCGHCLRNGTCNMTTGECHEGCDPGWTSQLFCNQSALEDKSSVVPIVVGVVVPCIVVLIVVAVILILRQRTNKIPRQVKTNESRTSGKGDNKCSDEGSNFMHILTGTNTNVDKSKPKVALKSKTAKKTNRSDINKPAMFYENMTTTTFLSNDQTEMDLFKVQADDPEADLEIYDDMLQLDVADNLYRNDTAVYGSLKKVSKDLDSLQQFLVDRLASGEILMEFKELPKGLPLPHHTALIPINKRKNRFTSVVP